MPKLPKESKQVNKANSINLSGKHTKKTTVDKKDPDHTTTQNGTVK